MKFRLINTHSIYCSADELLRDYPQLSDKVEIIDGKAYITIEKADEFMKLANFAGEIVVGKNFTSTNELFIEIYDGYRE